MKKEKIIKALVIFAVSLLCFYSLNDVKVPLSTSLFYALVFSEVAVVAPAIALVVSFLRYKSTIMLADAFLTAAGAILIRSVCKKRDRRPGAESVIFILLSQSPYVAFYEGEIINKLVYTAVITVFYFVSTVAVNTIYHKNITAKPSLYEVLCCAALYTAVTLGIMNFAGANVYKAISVFLLLFAVKLYKTPTAAMAQTFLALPIAIYTGDIGYFAFFAALFFVAYVLKDAPAVLSAIALPATDAAFAFLLDFYADYGYIEALFVFIPAFLFALLPTRLFDRLSEKGYMGGDRLSVRTIARVKSNLSGKVYDLASAFAEMNGALEFLSQTTFQKRAAAQKICALCYERACVKCSNHHICDLKPDKLVELGISKGRLTLVDLPKDFMDDCINPNPLIFEINRLIEGFNRRMEQLKKADDLKNILSLSALGISRRLEEVAFELSAAERVDKKRERALSEYLLRRGVKTYGIVVCSDDVVEMLIPDSADVDFIVKAVSDFSDAKFAVRSSQKTGEGLTYLELRPAASLKVAFGVSAVTKSDREASGDVHSLIKLSEEKL
ncbi:MAG: hypothetical protein ILP02_01525, partial [Clostridia bacterium]|nr:hypothetical protein [Clostridia bacterium]